MNMKRHEAARKCETAKISFATCQCRRLAWESDVATCQNRCRCSWGFGQATIIRVRDEAAQSWYCWYHTVGGLERLCRDETMHPDQGQCKFVLHV